MPSELRINVYQCDPRPNPKYMAQIFSLLKEPLITHQFAALKIRDALNINSSTEGMRQCWRNRKNKILRAIDARQKFSA